MIAHRLGLALLMAAAVAACSIADGSIAIRTRAQPDNACLQARVGGTLVADAEYGLALENPGYRNGTVWPFGFSARRESGVILLIGPTGKVVAREGDRIRAAGGSNGDDATGVYCDIVVNPEPDY